MRKQFATVLRISAILFVSVSLVRADTRLAVGTFGITPESRDRELADFLTIRLSNRSGIETVERRDLDRVLKEVGLQFSGLVRAKDAIRVGHLLRADQFLLGSTVRFDGTNNVVLRLVNARNGAIIGIKVVRDSASFDTLADEILTFISEQQKRGGEELGNYLAIGVIQNLGLNNRFPDFPAQIRAEIATALSVKVTVLERDVVSFIANEVRLDMLGLTDLKTEARPEIQFGFWIVDGFYQSYEAGDPEVQLKLKVERVLGEQWTNTFQGPPGRRLFNEVSEFITATIKERGGVEASVAAPKQIPTPKGEIEALEDRAKELVEYSPPNYIWPSKITIRPGINPDKSLSALDEATRVFRSILLIDPGNNAAKMRLATCLLYKNKYVINVNRPNEEQRLAEAREHYGDLVSSSNPEYSDDAKICLAHSYGGLKGVDMLNRFAAEATDEKSGKRLQVFAKYMLQELGYSLPIESLIPYFRNLLFQELKEAEETANNTVNFNFETVLEPYRFDPEPRRRIVDELLPDLLRNFPRLEPYILLNAATEQTAADSAITRQFLESLTKCEEDPARLLQPKDYFTHLCSTSDEEAYVGSHGGKLRFDRTFENEQHKTIIHLALARQRAAARGLAPPLTDHGKTLLAKSYMATQQWKEALDLWNRFPNVSPEVLNECRRHLGLATQSEEIPETEWKPQPDGAKVKIGFDCIQRGQWFTALSIFESMGYRPVAMSSGGPWGSAFTPVLPQFVAAKIRERLGKTKAPDPKVFDLGETPYVHFLSDGRPRHFSFQADGEDLWLATYSQIKRFAGAGPFAASNPVEQYDFERTTPSAVTSICVTPDFVWAGTSDDGLLEVDRKTRAAHRLSMKDGLFLNGISGLHVQGDNLWITYRNGGNGAVGWLDLKTRKFSSFTPKLSTTATDHSPLFPRSEAFSEPPEYPIEAFAEGELGDLWFVVKNKGIQRYRRVDHSWLTIGRPLPPANHLEFRRKIEQTGDSFNNAAYFTSVSNPGASVADIAIDNQNRLVLLAAENYAKAYNERSQSGGLLIYNYKENTEEIIQVRDGLPSNHLTAIALDGRRTWVGGLGSVAVVDISEHKVLRVANISAARVAKIQLGEKYAWIQISCVPGGGPDFAGDARTGVYRVERVTVEPQAESR
jgi:hypothetical protein